jgi:iron(II)-dependent oxidoreductase
MEAIKQVLRDRLEATRQRTLWLMDQVPDEVLRVRVHDFYSPIGWHFGHVGRTEEFWIIVEALGQAPRDPHLSWLLADLPDNPKDNRTSIPDRAGLKAYMAATREATLEALERADLSDPSRLLNFGYGWDFAIQHECQHQETIAEMLTLLAQRRGVNAYPPANPPSWSPGLEPDFVEIPGGCFTMGSDDPFGYDNEHAAHEAEVAAFELARYPVTAYQWSEFIRSGGYQNPALWSKEGWDWRCRTEATLPEYWTQIDGAYFSFYPMGLRPVHPDEPAGCLSWFEADAYGRWSGHRLPTEVEWEFAAGATPEGVKNRFPWGGQNPDQTRANFGLNTFSLQPVQNFPRGASRWGVEGLAGNLWEWTSSAFLPYPGFEAYPYDGYSKDHMKGAHRVCRGGSFATAPEILRTTFRNWYVPNYRQGFLGLRVARG